jgi:molybdopterin-guanine dinucleotide biosynthesis protein A
VSGAAAPSRGAVVLAGGRSTRMGRDKASLVLGGATLLARVIATLARVVDEVVVVAREGQPLPPSPPLPPRVRLLRAADEVEDRGPLGGLVPGLRAASADLVYASACDVPFLSEAFVRRMFDATGDADLALPEAEGRLHPLGGVYRRARVLPEAEALLAAGRLRPVFLLERLRGVRVPEADLRAADPALDSLANLNTPDAYAAALRRFEET